MRDLAVAPSLATSWEMPSDTEYVFALADDAVFSNGRPMTAEDVAGRLSSASSTSPRPGPDSSVRCRRSRSPATSKSP